MKHRVNKKRLAIAFLLLGCACLLSFGLYKHMEYRTYKLEYKGEIAKYAAQYKIDPYLVASIIHVESANRPAIVSSKGAVGLMQLMPETAEWICGKLKISYDEEKLKEPDYNIKLGCWYYNFIKERIPQEDSAIAAYNAGHSIVQKWLGDQNYSSDGKTLKEIPYEQTKNYVIKINKAYEKYKALYAQAFSG